MNVKMMIDKAGQELSMVGRKVVNKVINAPMNYLKNNDRRNKAAKTKMDKMYPGGWSDSPYHMQMFNKFKSQIK